MGLKLTEKKSRILLEEDVIKAVDKHTNEDGTLDNDISCILEEVKSVVIMGSKETMENIKVEQPCEYCNFNEEPKEKHIELYKCTDTKGRYYALDIERPDGFIPEPWRNKPLRIQYCPICGRKLKQS